MAGTDQKQEDAVLKRILKASPTPNKAKPKDKGLRKRLRVSDPRNPEQIAKA